MHRSLQYQGFQIINAPNSHIDAAAQFMFRGYMISMSSMGYSHHSCLNEIAVFEDSGNGGWVYSATSVEQAIDWVLAKTKA